MNRTHYILNPGTRTTREHRVALREDAHELWKAHDHAVNFCVPPFAYTHYPPLIRYGTAAPGKRSRSLPAPLNFSRIDPLNVIRLSWKLLDASNPLHSPISADTRSDLFAAAYAVTLAYRRHVCYYSSLCLPCKTFEGEAQKADQHHYCPCPCFPHTEDRND